MKKILGTALLLAVIATASFAQEMPQRPDGRRTPEERATRQTEMMAGRLTLSEEQKTKIYDVNLKTARQNEKFREPKDSTNRAAVMQAKEAAFKKILSEEQFKQYEEMKPQRGEFRRERRPEQ